MSDIRNLKQIEDAEQADTVRSLNESTRMALVHHCGSGEFKIRHNGGDGPRSLMALEFTQFDSGLPIKRRQQFVVMGEFEMQAFLDAVTAFRRALGK